VRPHCTDAPFTSPLDPSWTGFTVEEAEILKGNARIVYLMFPVLALMMLSYILF
jgi:hypothetical protein